MNWLLVVNLNTSICPLPEGISPMDPAQYDALAEWLATFSRQAFILLFVTHVLQAGLGAFVAAALAKSGTPAVVVIWLSVLGGVVNFINLREVWGLGQGCGFGGLVLAVRKPAVIPPL